MNNCCSRAAFWEAVFVSIDRQLAAHSGRSLQTKTAPKEPHSIYFYSFMFYLI